MSGIPLTVLRSSMGKRLNRTLSYTIAGGRLMTHFVCRVCGERMSDRTDALSHEHYREVVRIKDDQRED